MSAKNTNAKVADAASATPEVTSTAAIAASVAAKSVGKWKKDFGAADLTVAVFMGTAFFFLSLVDYSYDSFIYSNLTPATATTSNVYVQSLASFYQWRLVGKPFLPYWEIFVVCLLPLIIFTLIKANIDTVRGIRAPWGRHLLDLESLAQLSAMIFLVAAKAKPATQKFVQTVIEAREATDAASKDVNVFGQVTDVLNYHFLIFGLNALQWFVPFLRLAMQKKQDAIRAKEEAAEIAAANKVAVAAAKAKAATPTSNMPTAEEMAARMKAAEGLMHAAPQEESQVRKRK